MAGEGQLSVQACHTASDTNTRGRPVDFSVHWRGCQCHSVARRFSNGISGRPHARSANVRLMQGGGRIECLPAMSWSAPTVSRQSVVVSADWYSPRVVPARATNRPRRHPRSGAFGDRFPGDFGFSSGPAGRSARRGRRAACCDPRSDGTRSPREAGARRSSDPRRVQQALTCAGTVPGSGISCSPGWPEPFPLRWRIQWWNQRRWRCRRKSC